MSDVSRDWASGMDGSLVLRMCVRVNGELLCTQRSLDTGRYGGPPADYIERDMRRSLMHEVERRLFNGTL